MTDTERNDLDSSQLLEEVHSSEFWFQAVEEQPAGRDYLNAVERLGPVP